MRLLLLWGWIIIPGYGAMVGPEEVSGPEGSSLSVQCSYEDNHQESKKYWCQEIRFLLISCVTVISTKEAGKEERDGRMSIRDNPQKQIFTVTIRNLTLKDAGKYRCGISKLWFDDFFQVKVVVFPGFRSTVSPIPSLQPLSTRNVQQRAKVWETQSQESTSSSYHPRVITPPQEKMKPETSTNLRTKPAIPQLIQETLQPRTKKDEVQAVTSHHGLSDMNLKSRTSIPLIRILAPCIILLLLLVVSAVTFLVNKKKEREGGDKS